MNVERTLKRASPISTLFESSSGVEYFLDACIINVVIRAAAQGRSDARPYPTSNGADRNSAPQAAKTF